MSSFEGAACHDRLRAIDFHHPGDPLNTVDNNSRNAKGRIVAFDEQQFIDEICGGARCCLCGKPTDEGNSNREHVIPDWLLRHVNLHSQSIALPNGTPFKYGQYVIPCCIDCNSDYGERLEQRISLLLTSGYDHFMKKATAEDYRYLFVWLAWVYFKTHYKDTSLRLHRDRRKGDHMISDVYSLRSLHHIHAIARSLHTDAVLDEGCYGTLLVLRAEEGDVENIYDYRDFIGLSTLLIRVDDLALLVCLDDGGLCGSYMLELQKGIGNNALSPIQLREMLGRLTYERSCLLDPPSYATAFYPADGSVAIVTTRPGGPTMRAYDPLAYGEILYYSLHNMIEHVNFSDNAAAIHAIRSGEAGFMFDQSGCFVVQGKPTSKR